MKTVIFGLAALLAGMLAGVGPVRAADLTSAYPGRITLEVDLSDAPRKLFHARLAIPVRPGPLTLYYPKWIPGEHAPSGPLENVAGLKFTAEGKPLAWRRDLADMYAIHLDVPPGAGTLDVVFDFLSPTGGGEFGQSVSATPDIVDLEWNQVLMYPAGYASKAITIVPSVRLPAGWRYATALETAGSGGGEIHFRPVALNELVDSPLIAGRYFKQINLAPEGRVPVFLDLVADGPENLAVTPAQIGHYRKLVEQAYALFDSHHYGSYHFLFTLSDNTGHFGLEHHQSSDDRTWADYFTNPDTYLVGSGLLPHEYVHSWNGKFRRPADLWTPDFNTVPMKDDLLWVYEGLTQYFGAVLTARSGLWNPQQFRDALALTAADMDHRPGRTWRPLQDTADEAQILYYAPGAWGNWRRGVDFYPEGALLWLDVDTKLRELSHDKRSMNDFARAFYGMDNGSYATRTYTFDDVVAALNRVEPYDWAAFLRRLLDRKQYHAPLGGLARGGYRLVYTDRPSGYFKATEKLRKFTNQMYSIGLAVSAEGRDNGRILDVLWDGPAFKAGLAPGMRLVAVNGRAYTPERLAEAIRQAQASTAAPIRLLVRNQDEYRTYNVDYHGGLKYPHLERVKGTPDYLDRIITPLKPRMF